LIEKPYIFLTQYKESPLFETLYQLIIKSKLEEFNKMDPYQTNYFEINLLNEFSRRELSLLISKYKQNVFNMDISKKETKPCVLFRGVYLIILVVQI
jgi:hypothetical protein